jgi:hypothetical protein
MKRHQPKGAYFAPYWKGGPIRQRKSGFERMISLLRPIFAAVAALICAAGASAALLELRGRLELEGVQAETARFHAGQLREAERGQALEHAAQAGAAPFSPPQSEVEYARLLKALGDQAREPQARIAYYCESLSALGEALRRVPFDSQYLMNWANMRQLLGTVPCPQPYTRGDYGAAAAAAPSSNPTSSDLKYTAALLSLWSGGKARALSLFREVLTYKADLSAGQRQLIFSQISDESDLIKVVPGRFPQAVQWFEYFRENAPKRIAALRSAFGALQLKALEEGTAEYERGAVPAEIHYRHLVSLAEAPATPLAARRTDQALASYLRTAGEEEAARYFEERSTYEPLEVVRSRREDTRPLASCLARWGRDDWVYFDSYYASLGFYLPPGQRVRLIEVKASNAGEHVPLELIRVLVSEDNELWQELQGGLKAGEMQFSGRQVISLRLPEIYFKYWKVHFGAATRRNSFRNSLQRMVRVYGYVN